MKKKLENNKVVGQDGILYEFYKDGLYKRNFQESVGRGNTGLENLAAGSREHFQEFSI